MKLDLDALAAAAPRRAPRLDVGDLVAAPGVAPRRGQSAAPRETYTGRKPPVQDSPDLQRVLALPRRERPDGERSLALVEAVTDEYRRPDRPPGSPCACAAIVAKRRQPPRPCIERLNAMQAEALHELSIVGGLFGLIAVGAGKSILDLLAPLAVIGTRTAVVLVPPTLVQQLADEYELAREHFRVPSLIVHGRAIPSSIVADAPTLHVLPYSRLSMKDSTVLIEALDPDLIIADEADRLRNIESSAGASRIHRRMKSRPQTPFACYSGSMTESGVGDYDHLAAWALKQASPLPLDPERSLEWGGALDAGAVGGDWRADPGALLEGLVEHGFCAPGEDVRDGYRRRLLETPGVVATFDLGVPGVEIEISERHAPPVPAVVSEAMDRARGGERPDGEILLEAIQQARCARELACGFFYYWHHPLIDGREQDRDVIDEWRLRRREWRSDVREVLRDRRPHMDSPFLVTLAAMRGWGEDLDQDVDDLDEDPDDEEAPRRRRARPDEVVDLPRWKPRSWPRWREVKTMVRYETRARRLDDYLIRDAAAWAGREPGSILWYSSSEVGRWLAEVAGVAMHGGGLQAGRRILREDGRTPIAASIHSHGRGRDGLQRVFHRSLVVQPQASASGWEQLIGRTYRQQQPRSLVTYEFFRHTRETRRQVDQALRRAIYVERTMGMRQALRVGWALGREASAADEWTDVE